MSASRMMQLGLAVAVLACLPVRARAGDGGEGDAPSVRTLEDLFTAFVPGEKWPEVTTSLHLLIEDGPRSNRPNGASQLRGTMDGYDVGVNSSADDGTVKAVLATLELDAGDVTGGAKEYRRIEALFGAVAARRACQVVKTVEPARSFRQGGLHRVFEVRKLRCDDGKVEVEAFVDLGERVEAKRRSTAVTPGHVGLTARVKG